MKNCPDRTDEQAEKEFGVGEDLMESEDYEGALEAFERAIGICPESVEAWNNRGVVLWKLGRNEEALEAYHRALEIDSKEAVAWYNKSVVLKELGRDHEAKKALDKHDDLVFKK